jgi:hypothetical protein
VPVARFEKAPAIPRKQARVARVEKAPVFPRKQARAVRVEKAPAFPRKQARAVRVRVARLEGISASPRNRVAAGPTGTMGAAATMVARASLRVRGEGGWSRWWQLARRPSLRSALLRITDALR